MSKRVATHTHSHFHSNNLSPKTVKTPALKGLTKKAYVASKSTHQHSHLTSWFVQVERFIEHRPSFAFVVCEMTAGAVLQLQAPHCVNSNDIFAFSSLLKGLQFELANVIPVCPFRPHLNLKNDAKL